MSEVFLALDEEPFTSDVSQDPAQLQLVDGVTRKDITDLSMAPYCSDK